MIYLDLNVKSQNDSINYYTKTLGLFEHLGEGRLCCLKHEYLIIDLVQSEETNKVNFGIYFYNGLEVIENLKKNNISYELHSGIAGKCLSIVDIDGHQISLLTEHLEMT